MSKTIPVNRPLFTGFEGENLDKCLDDGWIAQGSFVSEFEKSWAGYCNRTYGVAVANGTAALELALGVLDLPHGAEVIMPSFTIMSCALAALHNNLMPVFVDVDKATWCLDPAQVEKAITPNTKAMMVVHTFGMPCDMTRLVEIAAAHDLYIIEDAAQAHGALYGAGGKRCGSYGIMSCFSFYANKLITTGEGGMVVTDNEQLADAVRGRANLCFGSGQARYVHTGVGRNYRLSNIQAAIGCAQFNGIQDAFLRKQWINARYRGRLSGLSGIKWQCAYPDTLSNYWVNGLLLTNGQTAEQVMGRLRDEGVETRPFFHPLHLQSAICGRYKCLSCPNSEMLAQYGFYLPSGVGTTDEEVDNTSFALRKVLS